MLLNQPESQPELIDQTQIESTGLSARAKQGIAAISAVAMLGAGGAFMLNRGGEEAPTETPVATQPESDTVSIEQPVAERPDDESFEQPVNPEAGSTDSYSVTRANGETITYEGIILDGSFDESVESIERSLSVYFTTLMDESVANNILAPEYHQWLKDSDQFLYTKDAQIAEVNSGYIDQAVFADIKPKSNQFETLEQDGVTYTVLTVESINFYMSDSKDNNLVSHESEVYNEYTYGSGHIFLQEAEGGYVIRNIELSEFNQ